MRRPTKRATTIALIITGLVITAVWAYHRAHPRTIVAQQLWYMPPPEWLEKKLGGFETVTWQAQSQPQPGDEVWSFRSPPESWKQLMGTAGVCLVRHGKIVAGYVTLVN